MDWQERERQRPQARAARMERWWADWRAADYTWDGLDKRDADGIPLKPWLGWVWSKAKDGRAYEADQVPEGLETISASLQHYWIEQFRAQGVDDYLVENPADPSERYSLVHLPPHWADGTPTDASKRRDAVMAVIEACLAAAGETLWTGGWMPKPAGTDRRAQLGGSLIPDTPDPASFGRIVRADFTQAGFLGNLNWSSEVADRLTVEQARFNSAAFSDAGFNSAAFSGAARFDSAAFSGYALFSSAAFSGDAWFDSAAFSEAAWFLGAAFSGYASFNSAVFSGDAWFDSAAFSGYALFNSAVFSEDARFDSVAFSWDARFDRAAFSGVAWFNSAVFSGRAGFNSAVFSGDAWFDSAAFSGIAGFNSAHFESAVRFVGAGEPTQADGLIQSLQLAPGEGDGADPGGEPRLTGALVSPPALLPLARRAFQSFSAEGAVFVGDADFSNRVFLGPSSFRGASFLGLMQVFGARLHPGVNLHEAQFRVIDYEQLGVDAPRSGACARRLPIGPAPQPWPGPSRRLQVAAEEEGDAAWTAKVQSDRCAALAKAQAQRREKIRSDFQTRGETPPVHARLDALADDLRHDEVERSFRALKHAMEDIRARRLESHFFKLELKARRQRKTDALVPLWERLLSWLYDLTADYGDSVVRPLIWMFGLWLAFGLFYWLLAPVASGATVTTQAPNGWTLLPGGGDALQYSLGRTTLFGAISGDTTGWAWLNGWDNPADWTSERPFWWAGFASGFMRALAVVQSLIAATLTFLTALAIRRKFQIT